MKLLPKPYYVIKTLIHEEGPVHVLHLINLYMHLHLSPILPHPDDVPNLPRGTLMQLPQTSQTAIRWGSLDCKQTHSHLLEESSHQLL